MASRARRTCCPSQRWRRYSNLSWRAKIAGPDITIHRVDLKIPVQNRWINFAKRSKRTADRVVYHYAWTSEVTLDQRRHDLSAQYRNVTGVTFCRARSFSRAERRASFRARRATRYPPSENRRQRTQGVSVTANAKATVCIEASS